MRRPWCWSPRWVEEERWWGRVSGRVGLIRVAGVGGCQSIDVAQLGHGHGFSQAGRSLQGS